jgi:hypothetical protein
MVVEQPDDLRVAAAMLARYAAVGLANGGFPDNSVVCHAYRAVGGIQDSFIGGGALAVPADRVTSFFPNIYNEDWLFLLDDAGLVPVAVTGKVTQECFDPYLDSRRARSEESGDCLAEGLYALLDDGKRVADADREYWRLFLRHRRELNGHILAKIPTLDCGPAQRLRMIEALTAAKGRLELITPELCTSYLEAWRADRRVWQSYIEGLPSRTLGEALAHLGLRAADATAPAPRRALAGASRLRPVGSWSPRPVDLLDALKRPGQAPRAAPADGLDAGVCTTVTPDPA